MEGPLRQSLEKAGLDSTVPALSQAKERPARARVTISPTAERRIARHDPQLLTRPVCYG